MAASRTRSKSRASQEWQRPRFKGKTFCLAGTMKWCSRADATQLITAEAGQVVKGVNAELDYLILGQAHGSRTTSAEQRADKLNLSGKAAIQVLDEAGFHQLLVPDSETTADMLTSGPAGIERWNALSGRWWLRFSTDLRGADFRRCDLRDANLRRADLSGCDFRGATFSGAILPEIRGVPFDKVTGAVHADGLVDCCFKSADFGQVTDPQQCTINARDCNFDGVRFGKSTISRLAGCSAKRADLSAASLGPAADLSGSDLTRAKLAGARASYLQAPRAIFDHADLQRAELNDSDFTRASFRKANLRSAMLCNSNFTGAVLDGADLTGANIVGAKLTPEQINSAKGINPEDVQAGSIGPKIRQLEKVAGQSKRVSVSIRVDLEDDKYVQLSVDSWGQGWAKSRQTVCDDGYDVQLGTARTIADCLLELANRWSRGSPRIESVDLSVSRAPLKKKELKLLAVAAWCEAFGLDVVTEDELKERKKAAADDAEQHRDRAVADLRTAGVKKWNKLTVSQRASLGRMRRLDLAGLDLQSGKFDDLDFQRTDFSGAHLRKVRFDNADVSEAAFAGANAAGAWLSGIKASDASFQNADLRKSTIRAANLLRADFSGAILNGVDFSYSDVRGANFAGAEMRGNTLQSVKFDEKTAFPDGFDLPEALIWAGQGKDPRLVEKIAQVKSAGPIDFETFMQQLENNFDASRLKKAMKMLKAESFQLFAQVEKDSVTGVVKSQTDADLVYSCRLDAEGTFACCTQNLNPCGGLRGALCKHLLVLLVGLTKGEELDPTTINGWIAASKLQAPKLDKDLMSQVFLKYKGAEAGEIDWRPTETVPEDYYAF